MNSINQNQPEMNHQDLHGPDAVRKIQELVKLAQNCFFCTSLENGPASSARPMNIREVDDDGQLWLLCASDSFLYEELIADPVVRLYFQGSTHSDFLQLTGRATVTADQAKIKQLWEPILKTWFTEGLNDPRIRVIRVSPTEGYYWDTKHGMAVAGVKMLIGSLIGKTLDDSIEGELHV
ncbi:pyridoxamine 5'-phosphate oxidase family protein [Schlesneria sp.]|uniref:pyridoxamine 5'-phosphate oxidase family protein n=1 Tax=Schlesneria sp. TaxID=2762018 RepID=UPI002EF067C7